MILCCCLLNFNSIAQELTSQDSIKITYTDSLINLIQRGSDDATRIKANQEFGEILFKALQNPESFHQNFDSLKNVVVQGSVDGKFRVYTWTLPTLDRNQYTFFGYIQVKNKNGLLNLYQLIDSTDKILKPETEKLKSDRWLGCIYYKIIPVKKSGRIYYTLLGWKAVNDRTSQKLIDVLYFDKDIPKMGYPLFKTGKVFRNRIIFNFLAQITMVLRYEERKKLIVFDHLSGNVSDDMAGIGGPDGSYDAFKFKSGKWILLNDIDIRSTWKPKKNVPKPPEEPKDSEQK